MTLSTPKHLFRMSIVLLGVFLTLLSLKLSSSFINIPYVWISLIWFFITLYISLSSNSSKIRVVFFNAASIILFFGIVEIFFWQMMNADRGKAKVIYSDSNNNIIKLIIEHDMLGYVPIKNSKVLVNKYWKDGLKVNAEFTINSNGLRRSNDNDNLLHNKGIIFFGCSYTFGDSLNDEDTLPFQVGKLVDNEYEIYNFGFLGYGTHQMLSAIEHGLVEGFVDTKINYAIYQALPDHINRLLGWRSWDAHGPKYILDRDNNIKHAGHFDDDQSPLQRIQNQFGKSYLYRKITERKDISLHDIDLFTGMVSTAKTILEKLYPGIEFHVIFWDIGPWIVPKDLPKNIMQRLENQKINVHLISDILLNYNEKTYLINEHDSHPNALANKVIAEYITKKITK